jgi:hypothetical protein
MSTVFGSNLRHRYAACAGKKLVLDEIAVLQLFRRRTRSLIPMLPRPSLF